MPNAKVLSEKQAIVAALAERIKAASSGVLVDYKGITVDEDTALRTEMRKNGIEYSVVKNTLVRFAINDAGYQALDPVLNGTTSMATTTGDPIAPFRILNDYSKKLNDKFNIKAAFMEGQVLSDAEIEELAGLPSKEALISVVLGTMLAPITSLAVVLDQIAKKSGEAVPAEAAAEAPAEAPAAE
jgi:large subunit ribosomal protein L10